MKLAIPMLALTLLAFGCEQNKPAAQTTGIDVTTPAPIAAAAPAPQPVVMPVSETSTPTINAAIAPAGNTYTIKPGDTLWKIASSHYGDGKKWKQIVDANPGLEPSKMRVGQTITLP